MNNLQRLGLRRRKEIFCALVIAQDAVDLDRAVCPQIRLASERVREAYELTPVLFEAVISEGLTKLWPPLEP